MRNRFAQRALVVAVQATLFVALAATTPAWAAETMVKIENFAFNPQRLTIKPGTTVVWENTDQIPHTVVSSTKSFRSQALDTGDKYSFTFTSPGLFEYFCSLHPHMTGTIVVETTPSGGGAAQ